MADREFGTAQDYQDAWDDWHEKYGIAEFIDNDEAGWARVQTLDPKLVWTSHSTCENEVVTTGAAQYSGCCWSTYGWYVGTTPWTDDRERVDASATISCQDCNPDGEGDGSDDCSACEGNGFVQHYFD